MLSRLQRERETAIQAVLQASKLCQSVFKNIVASGTLTKNDKSPVTIADFGAQAVVNSILHKHFPHDRIVGEEDADDLRKDAGMANQVLQLVNGVVEKPMSMDEAISSIDLGNFEGGPRGRFWTLDPIDGTKGFLRGEQYAVCLALVVDGIVELGVLGCPNLPSNLRDASASRGSLFVAVRGEGAFQVGRHHPNRHFESEVEERIRATDVVSPSETFFCESVESGHSNQSDSEKIGKLLGITASPVRMDSQCKYGVVSRGEAGIYLRVPVSATYQEKIWDHAGGSLLIEESGGVVSDVTGKPLDFSQGRTLMANKGVIAAGRNIYSSVLDAVKQVIKL
ncbi:hypothetical protein HDU67_007283 [Dinochytrium kinnereticum]|nr:hypothetical protein HDU67_007283 [Dinochytrium kinnereticum]